MNVIKMPRYKKPECKNNIGNCFIDSDDWTDTDSSKKAENEEENKIKLNRNETCGINGKTVFSATNEIQEFNADDDDTAAIPSNVNEKPCLKEAGMDDFEFDFQSIDEAEQTEHLLKVRVHANFCMRCGTGFVQQKTLSQHLAQNECSTKVYSIEMPLTCSICGQRFIGIYCLRQHYMLHAQTKPFKCKECSQSFVTQRDLYSHFRIHKDIRPFACDLCPKTYVSARRLVAHKRHHPGERPYGCRLCSKRFNKPSRLSIHKQKHASKKPFKCKFCCRSYAQNSVRNLHMRTHTKSKFAHMSFLCEICGLTHVRSKSKWIRLVPAETRRESDDSIICLDEDSDEKSNDSHQSAKRFYRRESSESSDSVEIIEDPLQFTIDLVDD